LAVVEKKASDVDQMCDAVTYLCDEKLLEKSVILTAFKSFMEGYDDITIDVPQAHKYVAKLLVSFSISPSEVGGEEFPALEKAYDEIKVL
jgi:translation initiation factor 4G